MAGEPLFWPVFLDHSEKEGKVDQISPVSKVKKTSKMKRTLRFDAMRNQFQLQTMVWPAIIFVLIFSYIPMSGNIIAFMDYNVLKGPFSSPFVGFKHFAAFFTDPNFTTVLINTLGMNFLGLLFGFPAPILFALFLNEMKVGWFKKLVQTVSYLPYFVSWAVFGGLIITLLSPSNGAINQVLMQSGLISEPISFMTEPNYFWAIMVIAGIIKGVGYGSIIFIAAIAGVDPVLHESAMLDGAGRFARMWHVTLPSIAGTVAIMLIFAIASILNTGYEQIIVLQNPLNLSASETIDTYVYKVGVQQLRYSYAAAVGLAKAVLAVLLLLGANRISRKISDQSLF